jgi:hypothetical protein
MLDFGVMRSPTGHTAQNGDGEEVPTYADEFTSRCKVQGSSAASADASYRTVRIGGVDREVITAGLHLPVSAPATEPGWVFEVTVVDPSSDPRLLGRKYLVHNDPVKSNATARRLDVVEV